MQRLPKVGGFRSHKTPFETVYTGQLSSLSGIIDNYKLAEAGILENPYTKVKLLLNGEVDKKLSVKLQAASQGAVSELKKKGGEFKAVGQIGRAAKTNSQSNQ
jgi:large subunit ribosomal protein L15